MSKNRTPIIILHRHPTAGYWLATDNDPDTLALFGTNTLPTAWRAEATPSEVLASTVALNPGVAVALAPEAR